MDILASLFPTVVAAVWLAFLTLVPALTIVTVPRSQTSSWSVQHSRILHQSGCDIQLHDFVVGAQHEQSRGFRK